jgi:hypothetical protein
VDAKAKWSIANLKTPCVEPDYLIQQNGITWPVDPQFDRDIASFLNRRAKPCENGRIDRYGFELFLQSQKLLSRNYAAARLGMTPESLDMLIPRLPELGLSKKYKVYEGIYEASMSDDLVSTLPGLRFRTFGTHDFFCEFLHNQFKETLKLEIMPLYCRTSERLGGQRMFASTWDNVLLEPLSVKHSVWLDFGKPLSLAPDRCSKLFYAEHHEEMKQYLAGKEEPRDLGDYFMVLRRPA